ncbi:MAG: DUF3575 domain-containing protein [Flavobacteriaceae bacterium]
MKKIILTAMIAVLGFTMANAQESEGFKGKWFLMGQAGYNTTENNSIRNYSILPAVGNFIAPTVAIGGAIGYVGQSVKDSDAKTGAFIVQPLARKYWGINDKLYIFGQAAVPLEFGTITDAGNNDIDYTGYGFAISPGLDYFLSSHWSIEAQFGLLGWSGTSIKDGDSSSDFEFGLNSGLLTGINIGIKYVF